MTDWNEDQKLFRKTIEELGPVLSDGHVEADRDGEFSRAKWATLAASGLFGLPFDEAFGGLGQDVPTTMYVLEGLGHANRDGGLSFSASTHLASTGTPLNRFGKPALKQRLLPAVCAGEIIGAHAITEPAHGSDAMGMQTTAVPDGDHYILNGSKAFVSNGPVADVVVVYARTGNPGTASGISAFLVERGTPGLSFGNPIEKMGLRSSPLCELFLDNVRVPAENLLGRPGNGFLVLDHVMKREILYGFAINLGEMQYRLEQATTYARERTQFGSPIGSFQAVQHRVVDMLIGTETARHWLYSTGRKLAQGKDVTTDVAITKLVVSEAALASALNTVSVFGGYGYMAEYGFEKDVRNAVAGTIYSGTTEIQKSRVAAMLGLG
ncbi:acyl-CoA dehydrogenase family protein [Actinokineospora globicatena]|uniref:Acyl-CoA dehydrogenase n=1 Tax=Actinokineospora globicatena TaxID=103729 RepID=A0A9W6V7A9_9PSEU|nr:acyl-CoA dehydrogenase family protein [Actinokineospora globicatena]GLW91187.1 acyl-CoA dehydrogenase [Actinokineospora globicatena]